MEERRVHKTQQDYFIEKYGQKLYFVGPGSFFCSGNKEDIIYAETGAGVIICIYDAEVHVAGMAHILISEEILKKFKSPTNKQQSDIYIRYACEPIEELIKNLKRRGAGKKRVNVRIAGGADTIEEQFDIGLKNAVFCQNEIMEKGLRLLTKDIGGKNCRRINLFPFSGRMEVHPMRRKIDREKMLEREQRYLEGVKQLFHHE